MKRDFLYPSGAGRARANHHAAGRRVVCNLDGANMESGVATTLIKNTSGGRLTGDVLLLETDERFLPIITSRSPSATSTAPATAAAPA